jgi:hypothetical protein
MYLYTETSGGSAGVEAILQVCFDASTLVTPTVEFWYHMWNGTGNVGNMGTLEVNQSLDDGVTYTSNLFSKTGDQGNQWHWSGYVTPDTSAANGTVNTDVYIQIKGIRGLSFNSDMSIDDFKWGEPSVIGWQMNTDGASFDINGVLADGFNGAFVNQTLILCGGGPVAPVTGSFNWSTAGAANAFYETVVDTSPLVALGSGGIALAGGILNLSVASAANWTYLNGGSTLSLQPFAPWALPGAVGASRTVGYSINATTDISLQSVFVSPSFATGIELSQAAELHAVITPAVASIPGPTADDTGLIVDVTSGATCWFPNGISFNGTVYTSIAAQPNGRLMFSSVSDSDFQPTVAKALGDAPFLGLWADFSPNVGGSITLSNPAPGIMRMDWAGVPYFAQGATSNTWGIEVDDVNQVFAIDGLTGIAANPASTGTGDNQFLGLSPGAAGAATDPYGGVGTTFTAGGVGGGVSPTDAQYDFYNFATGGGLAASLVPGTLNRVEFQYVPTVGFFWSGS